LSRFERAQGEEAKEEHENDKERHFLGVDKPLGETLKMGDHRHFGEPTENPLVHSAIVPAQDPEQ
jgi:hypothetical protein